MYTLYPLSTRPPFSKRSTTAFLPAALPPFKCPCMLSSSMLDGTLESPEAVFHWNHLVRDKDGENYWVRILMTGLNFQGRSSAGWSASLSTKCITDMRLLNRLPNIYGKITDNMRGSEHKKSLMCNFDYNPIRNHSPRCAWSFLVASQPIMWAEGVLGFCVAYLQEKTNWSRKLADE